MDLNELKKSMSTLDQVLAKTNSEIKINVSASETAKTKILKKFRQGYTSCLILAVVFTASLIGNINPESFPSYLKIYLVVYLLLGAIWYFFMHRKLRAINIAEFTPAKLVSKTSAIKLLALSGEVFFIIGLAVLFTLLFPNAWEYNRLGFWAMAITLVAVLIYSVLHYWPKYIKLFSDLNSIK